MSTPIPFIPDNAPFNSEQRQWLNGYLAGLFSNAAADFAGRVAAGLSAVPAATVKPVTLLYGSQTGTAEGLAKKIAKESEKHGFAAKVVSMEKFSAVDFSEEENLLLITSTYGDGEPPDNAQEFWNLLKAETAPQLPKLRYSVLALGDTNYPAFCQFGKECDARLEALGAQRVYPRVDCDVDYETPAQGWAKGVFEALAGSSFSVPGTELVADTGTSLPGFSATYDRKNPFPARLLTNRLLNAEGSKKEVRHFEISLEGSGLSYEVGDALGVVPSNCPQLVDDLLATLDFDGEEAVKLPNGGETALRLALLNHYDITRPSTELLKAVAERTSDESFRALLDPSNREALKKWLWGREVLDALLLATTRFTPDELVSVLKKLQPRLYSISSSPKAHPNEVHLTVGAVRYETNGRARKGVCSTFLADRCSNTSVPVFVQVSHGFRVPADLDRPVIMVGPGTGIAPFRAFLEERRATDATGKNWLFFGDQCRATDFLYQDELEAMHKEGHLHRLDLAFSRDQEQKIYVQNRMLEAAGELWSWLENGAHFYVCGDASRMAKDVDAALYQVIQTAGGLSQEAAAEYVQTLKTEKRYQRDVY